MATKTVFYIDAVKFIIAKMDSSDEPIKMIAERSGVSEATIYKMKRSIRKPGIHKQYGKSVLTLLEYYDLEVKMSKLVCYSYEVVLG